MKSLPRSGLFSRLSAKKRLVDDEENSSKAVGEEIADENRNSAEAESYFSTVCASVMRDVAL